MRTTENSRLELHVPALEELWYRQHMMQDAATMTYNRGYPLSFAGYHKDTGCIDFPKEDWPEWFARFIGQEPDRFYAYILRREDGAFIGEVNLHKSLSAPWHEMGIVLEARYRGQGYAVEALELLLSHAFDALGVAAVHNAFESSRKAAMAAHRRAGFRLCGEVNGIAEWKITREEWQRNRSIGKMADAICAILADNIPSIYLYGSCVLGDFRLGWSDIDILVLTQKSLSPAQAESLVHLRQAMLEREPGNPYYRSFEGGMLPLAALVGEMPDRVVYWGTSGQRLTDRYSLDSFGTAQLLERGVLLRGPDVRQHFSMPSYAALRADVERHWEAIRKCAQKTERSFYSFGWLLDISRCIYTLRTGTILAKTAAGEWALKENLCPDRDALQKALEIRQHPIQFRGDAAILDLAESMGSPVQRYADVLAKELEKCLQ